MNRQITHRTASLQRDSLPPVQSDGRARLLFLSLEALGWRTCTQQLVEYAGRREDVDAVHVRLRPPVWMRLLNRHPPGLSAEASIVHPMTTWRWLLGNWLKNSEILDHFDVVHCTPMTIAGGPALLRKSGRFRLSCTTDATEVLWARDLHGLEPKPRSVQREVRVFSACDLVVPLCRWAGDSVVKDYGVDAGRVVVCRPTLPPELFKKALAGRMNPIPERTHGKLVRLIFVGNDWERKGGARVLRWHQERFADRVELHVVSAKAPIQEGLPNVIWHGSVRHEQLLTELLPCMDLFILPTRYDAAPQAIDEAVSVGLPVISSYLAGIPEVVRQGETGLLCKWDDDAGFLAAIERLVADSALRQTMSDNALAFAQRELTEDAQLGPMFDRLVALAKERVSQPAV